MGVQDDLEMARQYKTGLFTAFSVLQYSSAIATRYNLT